MTAIAMRLLKVLMTMVISFFASTCTTEPMINVKKCSKELHREVHIFHQNVCSISNKKDDFELYISGLDKQPMYVCMTEHFLNKFSAPLFNMNHYYMAACNTRGIKSRGGSLILAHQNCKCEELEICKKMYKIDSFELCGVKDNDTNLIILCLYRTPTEKNFVEFITKLESLLEHFFSKKVILVGDFNVDLLTNNRYKNDFLNILTCYNFRPLFDEATFIRNNSLSCIDNFLTNLPTDDITNIEIDHNNLADRHAGISGTYKTTLVSSNNSKFSNNQGIYKEQRNYCKKNKYTFRDNILNQNWHALGVNGFLCKFTEIFHCSFPKRKRKINSNIENKNRWISKGIRVYSKMKRFLSSGNKSNTDASILVYKHNYISQYRKVIRSLKRNTVIKELVKTEFSSKSIWNVVNKHRNKKKCKHEKKLTLKLENRITDDPRLVVDTFSKLFNHSEIATTENFNAAHTILTTNTLKYL
ncbi:uncharacterized protein LOC125490303 [Plutella xylostella]|uniref:uncharacterized protein LOC125490303 n=1 Tax=Plutella xylostella TaxID=51655 RepID=UPI00203297C6|nr:uncharacterized protein LOC125490303 [Plutella xylostella]